MISDIELGCHIIEWYEDRMGSECHVEIIADMVDTLRTGHKAILLTGASSNSKVKPYLKGPITDLLK